MLLVEPRPAFPDGDIISHLEFGRQGPTPISLLVMLSWWRYQEHGSGQLEHRHCWDLLCSQDAQPSINPDLGESITSWSEAPEMGVNYNADWTRLITAART